ncbi:hypothetical protein ACRAWF_27610 [Streptomyces sp. L7]
MGCMTRCLFLRGASEGSSAISDRLDEGCCERGRLDSLVEPGPPHRKQIRRHCRGRRRAARAHGRLVLRTRIRQGSGGGEATRRPATAADAHCSTPNSSTAIRGAENWEVPDPFTSAHGGTHRP